MQMGVRRGVAAGGSVGCLHISLAKAQLTPGNKEVNELPKQACPTDRTMFGISLALGNRNVAATVGEDTHTQICNA